MVRRKVEDLRRRPIICFARGCRRLFRADIVGLECVQMRSFSPAGRVSDASSMAAQIAYSSAESLLDVLGKWDAQGSLADMLARP